MRSVYYTKQNIHAHIFDILTQYGVSYDVYLHTYHLNAISNARSREFNVTLNKNEWKLLYPFQHLIDDNVIVEREIVDPLIPEFLKHGDPWDEGPPHTSLRNLIKQFYSLKRVTELWSNRTDKYPLVLYLRPDVWFFNDLNKTDIEDALTETSKSFLYVPTFHSWGGVNDRFAFGPPETMKIYGFRFNQASSFSKVQRLHPETFLHHLLNISNITIKPTDILFERVRSNGILWGVPTGQDIPEKANTRYQLVKNIIGQWNAIPIEKKVTSGRPKSKIEKDKNRHRV